MAGPIRISILANAAKARAEIDSVAERSSRLKDALAAGMAAVGVAAGGFAVNAVKQASDLNETLNKSAAIFGENAKSIEQWAAGASKSVGLSKQAALESAASFGDMFQQIGFTGQAATDLSKKTVQLAADFGSFNNLDTADVADRISAAYRGEFDSLQALVPNINAARVEQEALALSHKKTAKELTAQDKALAVNAILTKDGARAMGDFAKTSDSAANKQKTLKADFDNISATVGTKLIPALSLGLTALSRVLDVLSNPAVQVAVVAVGGLAAAVYAVNAAAKVYAATQAALNIVMAANPIGLVVIAIAALVAAIVVAYKRSETFRGIVQAVGSALLNAGRTVVAFGASVFAAAGKVAGFVRTAVEKIKGLPAAVRGALSNAKTLLLQAGRDVVLGFVNGIKSMVGAAARAAADMAAGAFNAAKRALLSRSPSKKFMLLGTFSGQGFSIGMARTVPAVKAAARRLATQALAATKAKLANQRKVVADLIKARADYAKTVTDATRGGGIVQLAKLEDVPKGSQAGTIVESYRAKLAAVREFTSGITRLGRQGLGRGILSQLVEAGPEQAGGIVSALRNAGPAILREITALDARIARESAEFGAGFANASFRGRIAAASAPPITLEFRPSGDPLMDALLAELRKTIRVKGGNVQKVLGVGR